MLFDFSKIAPMRRYELLLGTVVPDADVRRILGPTLRAALWGVRRRPTPRLRLAAPSL